MPWLVYPLSVSDLQDHGDSDTIAEKATQLIISFRLQDAEELLVDARQTDFTLSFLSLLVRPPITFEDLRFTNIPQNALLIGFLS